MTVRWVDDDPFFEESLNSQLPTEVEVSPCGLTVLKCFIDLNAGKEGYKHIVKQATEYDFSTDALCGVSFFPSNVEALTGLVSPEQLDDELLCEKCGIEAEYIFYAKWNSNV